MLCSHGHIQQSISITSFINSLTDLPVADQRRVARQCSGNEKNNNTEKNTN